MTQKWIELEGIKQNNLKNISLKLPRNKFIVITGVSGSGKSSLAFDVINNEGRRKYFINLSGQARKYLDKLEKPKAESIKGLTPTIAVSQSQNKHSPRSTVGTLTEIYDFLRLLYARLGKSADSNLEINRALFSFNNPKSACPVCRGLGLEDQIDPQLLLEDENKSIRERAFKITNPKGYIIYSQVTIDALNQVCEAHGFSVDIPWKDLTAKQQDIVLNGSDIIKIPYGKHTLESRMRWSGITAKPREEGYYKGILPVMNEILKRDRNPNILRFAKTIKCSKCQGKRLSEQALSVKINDYTIADLVELNLNDLLKKLQQFRFKANQYAVAQPIMAAIQKRIDLLDELGLGYLTCSRPANTLSSNEIQRIRLAKQINSKLQNITFVFDEPSAGIHAVVNHQIIKKQKELVANGNTVITVEHDKETIVQADWIVEIGPKAGQFGGEILFNGSKEDFLKAKHASFTLDYLNDKKQLFLGFPRQEQAKAFYVRNASINNLENIDVAFKYNQLNVLSGISGAGKSSLLFQTLIPLAKGQYNQQINASGSPWLDHFNFSQIHHVDQSAIGKTARSTPATYTKIFDAIRKLYASLPLSKGKKYTASTFSYNTAGGRCEKCEGAGRIETGMHFLGNVERVCESCNGRRYTEDLESVLYKDKSIADVLALSFNEALTFFKDEPKISKQLEVVKNIGLGYLKLGQSSNSLSGGEAQRIRLATELIRGNTKNSLYIFNEPSTGLHFHDIQILLDIFTQLLSEGHTIIVIEHHLDIIKNAHHIVDLGSREKKQGGELLFSGSFQDLVKCNNSLTASGFELNTMVVSDKPKLTKPDNNIFFKGVTTNNLKSIDFEIPLYKTTAVIGPSGSGKSSLVFETLYAEAQNRFTESFPNYVRQFSSHYSRAKFESVSGMTPVIGIRQKNQVQDPRSTLATFTEIYDHYRLLYSRYGQFSCPECGGELIDKYCPSCAIQYKQKYSARHFSFNHSEGSCPECSGLGSVLGSTPDLFIAFPEKSLLEGAFVKQKSIQFYADPNGQYLATLKKVGEEYGIDYEKAYQSLSKEAISKAFYGTGEQVYDVEWQFKRKNRSGTHRFSGKWQGFIPIVLEEYYRKKANGKGEELLPFLREEKCPRCHGKRLNEEILRIKFDGINIAELCSFSISENKSFFQSIQKKTGLNGVQNVDIQLIENILQKLTALQDLGLGYLQLNRKTGSLSGGEYQRTLLGIQMNGGLSGITYVLDEPGTGLHPADFPIILKAIDRLKALGNTIVLSDHHQEIIQTADNIIQLGPKSGVQGGEIIYSGKPKKILTKIPFSANSQSNIIQSKETSCLSIKKATANNLKSIDVNFKLNQLNVVCGVSGSGKTSLVRDVLLTSIENKRNINCQTIFNRPDKDEVLWIASPKGYANRNIMANYLGLYDEIRKIFSKQESAKRLGFKASDFSFNSKKTQCPICKGQGSINVKLDFLSDVTTVCDACNGARFTKELLKVKYEGYNLSDILNLSIADALKLFSKEKALMQKLDFCNKIGLSYLKLSQKLSELSSGEFQRVKLLRSILSNSIHNQLILFDEPSKGLALTELHYLFDLFSYLLHNGCTLIVIEHNPHLIAEADHLIELGEGAGDKGGMLIFEGNFKDLRYSKLSKTANYFRENEKFND
jgi:excinuclease ABC subunit A